MSTYTLLSIIQLYITYLGQICISFQTFSICPISPLSLLCFPTIFFAQQEGEKKGEKKGEREKERERERERERKREREGERSEGRGGGERERERKKGDELKRVRFF